MHAPSISLIFVLIAALCAVSCTSTKPPGQAEVWSNGHLAFRAAPKWKSAAYVNEEVVAVLRPETTSIKISIAEQRGLLLHEGEHVAVDFPVSTGRRAFPTKPGDYQVIDKRRHHKSNLYGNYVAAETGKLLKYDADSTKDPLPEGAVFHGSPMPYFMRLTNQGLGLHVGKVPGYPASHGCIRVPSSIMPKVFALTPMRTPVKVQPEGFGLPEPTPAPVSPSAAVATAR
jgi:lipoprotein-anchoring transpeptidase ErfK/SrfK